MDAAGWNAYWAATRKSLRALSEQSGGFALAEGQDLVATLARIGIVIAWLVEPREKEPDAPNRLGERHLKLVFAAAVLDQARRRNDRARCEFPRPCLK